MKRINEITECYIFEKNKVDTFETIIEKCGVS
jgi:hypothetical protein